MSAVTIDTPSATITLGEVVAVVPKTKGQSVAAMERLVKLAIKNEQATPGYKPDFLLAVGQRLVANTGWTIVSYIPDKHEKGQVY